MIFLRAVDVEKSRLCACGCGSYFVPGRKDQIYLSRSHKDKAKMKRRRASQKSQKHKKDDLPNKREKYIMDKTIKFETRAHYLRGAKNGSGKN